LFLANHLYFDGDDGDDDNNSDKYTAFRMPSLLHVPRFVLMAALGVNIVGASIMEDGFGYKATTDVTSMYVVVST